jgi:hypothetical protein
MKFYTTLHKTYCGIDLHAKIIYVCILDQQGYVLLSMSDTLQHGRRPYMTLNSSD